MSDTITIRMNVGIGLVGCTRTVDVKVDREEWEEMIDVDRDSYMYEEMVKVIEWGYEAVE